MTRLSDRTPAHITNLNRKAPGLGNMWPWMDGGYFCVSFQLRSLERKRIHRVPQVCFVVRHRAEIVADLIP